MNCNERESATLLVETMDGAGENLFSRSCFTLQQDSRIARLCRLIGALENRCHARGVKRTSGMRFNF
jgi:hypothetical protein